MWNPGWDNIFRDNEWGRYPPEELVRFMSRQFRSADKSKVAVLEVGCGTGANLWYLAREGYDVHGIDGSEVAIARAKEHLIKENLKAALYQGDCLNLPFADGQFNCVLDIECIYANSFQDSLLIMEEIYRVLKPGGVFFSKTFMAGTHESALHKGYGTIRFTAREEIPQLYAKFKIENVDFIARSDKNMGHEIKEWLITCQKV